MTREPHTKRAVVKRRELRVSITLIFLTVVSANAEGPDRPERVEPSRDYDALHYRVRLRFDEDRKVFWGENTITVRPFRDGFSKCALDARTFRVRRVQDDRSRPLEFEQTDEQLIVSLTRPHDHDETVTFTAVYDTEDSDHERRGQTRRRGNQAGIGFSPATEDHPRVISALSFARGARHWFPCFDHPSDRVTMEVIATVRSGYSVLSNGRLVSVDTDEKTGLRTFHWSQEKPHPTYLSVLVAGHYHIIEGSAGSVPLHYWVYQRNAGDAMRSFHKTPDMMAFFTGIYGFDYPWVKYDQITIPEFNGGAECTSATILTDETIHDARAEQDFPSHGLVAHELAHQWWGDCVTLRDWGHVWINEGMATYGEYLYTRHDLGDDEGAVNLLEKKNTYLDEARRGRLRAIVDHRWENPEDNFDRHAYQKAAAVIHMLRFVLGDGPFHRTLAHFLREHAYEPVDTRDFEKAIKEATGQNLKWFFDQWFYRPGHPVFEVTRAWDAETKKLKVQIIQTQDTTAGVPVFRMPIVLGVVTESGRFSREVWLENAREEVELDCPSAPLLVRFDEGNHLLKEWTFAKSTEELLYQLQEDDVVGRMWAASELLDHVDEPHVARVLRSTARSDPFWAVRAEAVEALGAGAGHVDLFRDACTDPSSEVRVAALRALGASGRRELVPFLTDRFESDDSYRAQAQAVRALGRCGDREVMHVIDKAAGMRSPRDVIRRAAESAKRELEERLGER